MLKNFQSGQAALILVILILALAVVATLGLNLLSIQRQTSARQLTDAVQSYYVAESGIEDSLLRVISDDHTHEANTTLTLNGHTATITITESGDTSTITSEGDVNNRIRKLSTELQKDTVGASFFYGIQVDDGGLSMGNNSRVNGNVYSNGDITGGNGATITNDATVEGGLAADPDVAWEPNDSDHFFATVNSNRDIAQSFTASGTGTLPVISVYLAKVGIPTNDLTVHITTDNNGQPERDSLADATLSAATVSTSPAWVTVAFPTPANVTTGAKYWIVLDSSSASAVNHWNWRKDSTGGYPNHTGSTASDWNAGNVTWASVNGDLAFRAWIGDLPGKIEGMTIGDATTGTARAILYVNTTVRGLPCPNPFCLIENSPRQDLPIPEATIAGWKADAEAGGTINGDYTLTNSASASLGPKKITGSLTVDNLATLRLTGTVWVEGDVQLSNNCVIQLDESYGDTSGVFITDGVVQISNNCEFQGSGNAASYIMLTSEKDDPDGEVMSIDNNALGVIYYARRGRLKFSNNAAAKEATAYGITLDNNATITYESGLDDVNFSSGPSGGYTFSRWREID